MTTPDDLTALDTHFAFGENWAAYARLVDQPAIDAAERGLLKLIPAAQLAGATFLDIGCGSGVHSLAAWRLGISRLHALDIDPKCVETTTALLSKYQVAIPYQAQPASIFDVSPESLGQFDIVYSWGVLHHTGNMRAAIAKAASLVKPSGLFALALYRRTWLDPLWVAEKRWYAQASPKGQRLAQRTYDGLYRLAVRVTGRKTTMVRGMDYWHDLHDWLGGYPYEAILAPELDAMLSSLGFTPERVFARGKSLGLFGSGCDEYVYRKHA